MDVKNKVLEFFKSKDRNLSQNEDEVLKTEYMDAHIIDSMEIVLMIVEFEKAFGIHFSAENMQSVEFRTIGGLIKIVERLLKAEQNA